MSPTLYSRHGKRALDLALLLLVAPVALGAVGIVAVAVRLALGSPVLFRQQRPGLRGRPFTLLKFRTMRTGLDAAGHELPDAARQTALGRWLRSTSLDELPELWNVLRGDMSLVGPRPLLMEYLGRYSPEQARRHEVRPGISGWAQVNGRNAVTWENKFRYDVWYVDHLGLWLDLWILLRTLWMVVRRQGISAEGHVTMPPFEGSGT